MIANHISFGIEAAEQGRFSQLLIGGQQDTSLRRVFAPNPTALLHCVGGSIRLMQACDFWLFLYSELSKSKTPMVGKVK